MNGCNTGIHSAVQDTPGPPCMRTGTILQKKLLHFLMFYCFYSIVLYIPQTNLQGQISKMNISHEKIGTKIINFEKLAKMYHFSPAEAFNARFGYQIQVCLNTTASKSLKW